MDETARSADPTPKPPGNLTTRKERDRLIEEHLGLVRSLASRLRDARGWPVDLDELISCGTRGLVEAAERWDPARGVAFNTFAYYRIRGALFDTIRSLCWLPRRQVAFQAAADAYIETEAEDQPPAGDGKQALAAVTRTLSGVAAVFVASLEGRWERDMADPRAVRADEELDGHRERHEVRMALKKLPEREQHLVEALYFEGLTLTEASARLGLSKSWGCRLHARAVRLLAGELQHLNPEAATGAGPPVEARAAGPESG